jgi:hypothetical protein
MSTYSTVWGRDKMWGKRVRLALLAVAGLVVALLFLAAACGGGKSGQGEVEPGGQSTPSAAASETPAPATPTPLATPVAVSCPLQSPVEGQANLLHNAGLESGADPWCVLSPPQFEVSPDYAHSGQASALLRMRVPAETASEHEVHYLVQQVVPQEFPELVSGYYRVENWSKGTPKQYLDFVVIVCRDGPEGECTQGAPNVSGGYGYNQQMRYLLAGISEDPFKIGNAYFVYISKEEPRTGEWVYFERNIKEDFLQLWGAVPEGYDYIRVLFELRIDNKEAGDAPAEADVYYDDLYMGSASDNPNQP